MSLYRQDFIRNDPRILAAKEKSEFISYLMAGNSALTHNDYHAAIKSFKTAIKISPEYYLPYARLGLAFFKLEAFPEAASTLQKSLELNPEQVDALYLLAAIYQRMGMPEQAAATAEAARKKSVFTNNDKPKESVPVEKPHVEPVAPVSLLLVISRTLLFMASQPVVLMPFIVYYIATSLFTLGVNQLLLGSYLATFPTVINMNDKSQIFYYFIVGSFMMLFGIPMFASAMVSIRNIYAGRKHTFRTALKHSYERLPALIGTSMFSAVLLGGVGGVVWVMGSFITQKSDPQSMLYIKLAAVSVIWLFMPFFSFMYQCIVIERRTFEDCVAMSFELGGKHYIKTIILLAICGAPFLAIMKMAFQADIKLFILVRALCIPIMFFYVVSLTVFFMEAQEHRYKTDAHGDHDGRDDSGNHGKRGGMHEDELERVLHE